MKVTVVTRVERSGRQSDAEWFAYQIRKIKEHLDITNNAPVNFFPIDSNRIAMDCAFEKMDGGLRDPAGYELRSDEC